MKRNYHEPLHLAVAIRRSKGRIIAVDGNTGAGKSTLTRKLGKYLQVRPIHLDDFLKKRRGAYLRNIRYPAIFRKMNQASTVILDGICVLQVLDHIGKNPDVHVYVKQFRRGVWRDKDELCLKIPAEQYITQQLTEYREIAQALGQEEPKSIGIAEEIIRYHSAYRPQERATTIFVRGNDA